MSEKRSRTVVPDGPAIAKRRINRGWTVEELADRAKLNTKTITKIELSEPVFVCTLNCIRDAFGLSDLTEILHKSSTLPPAIVAKDPIQIRVRLKLPFFGYDFTNQLMNFINFIIRRIDPGGDFEVISVSPGSVIVTIALERRDANVLLASLASGELDGWDIECVYADMGSGYEEEFPAPDSDKPVSKPAESPPAQEEKPPSLLMLGFKLFFGIQQPAPTPKPEPYKDSAVYRESNSDKFKEKK